MLDTVEYNSVIRPSEIVSLKKGIPVVPREVVNQYSVECTKDPVVNIIKTQLEGRESGIPENEEAFYVIDLGTVVRKHKEWTDKLPRVTPYYAMKCNPNPAIIQTLEKFGVGYDCASKNEIQQILDMGVSPSRIIFANPTKMKGHITYAKSVGVDLMTFDNSYELKKIAESFPEAKLVLRIITDDSNSVCRFSSKFGAPLSTCEDLLSLAKSLNLNVVGISFHVGSGCKSPQSFSAAVANAHSLFQEAEKIGYKFDFLDLGGGWPGTDNEGVTFTEISEAIRDQMDELFPPHVKIIAEPGRYYVSESHTLAVNVFAKREMQTESSKQFLYYINDGVYQSFNCIFFDHASPQPELLETEERGNSFHSTIFGPTCDSMDCIAKGILLPELQVGEWIYFKNMGAYTCAAASPFNGFKAHPTIYYIDTFSDL